MIPDWAYAAAIGALLTALGILWKSHMDSDARERQRADVEVERERQRSDKETADWKIIAKDAIHDVGQLGDALNVRNRIDEELLRSGRLR